MSEALSHVLKRVRASTCTRLPVKVLLDLRVLAPPHRLNFLNIFLGIGFDRMSAADKDALLPALLVDLDAYPVTHRSLCMRLLVKVRAAVKSSAAVHQSVSVPCNPTIALVVSSGAGL